MEASKAVREPQFGTQTVSIGTNSSSESQERFRSSDEPSGIQRHGGTNGLSCYNFFRYGPYPIRTPAHEHFLMNFLPCAPCTCEHLSGYLSVYNSFFTRVSASINGLYQDCRVGVETGVGVGLIGLFWLESESELESVKFGRL